MKKISAVLMALIISCCLANFAMAEAKLCTIEELYMTIEVPENYYIFTREIPEDDPNLKRLGLTADELSMHFRASGIYLNGIDYDNLCEFVVIMNEMKESREIFNMADLTDEELQNAIDYFMERSETSSGKLYKESGILRTDTATFLVLTFSSNENFYTAYGVQYYTIYNGQAINFILSAYDNSYLDNAYLDMESIINSIKFTETLENTAPAGNFSTDTTDFLSTELSSSNYSEANPSYIKIILSLGGAYLIYRMLEPKKEKKAKKTDV